MLVLVIVLAFIVLLAVLLAFGGFGGYGGGYGADAPTVYRRIIYRRPARRVVTEHRVVDDVDPVDGPGYRR